MDRQQDVSLVVEACKRHLDLTKVLNNETYVSHPSLPLCVLEAVFSIGVRYETVGNVIKHYIAFAELSADEEQGISEFLSQANAMGATRFAEEALNNRHRTSSKNGILKAQAAILFAETLRDFGVERLEDKHKILDSDRFCRCIKAIPGQAISVDYFLMLLGREDLVKADRMVLRFLNEALDASVDAARAYWLLGHAADQLKSECPRLTPRLLDHSIWRYQSGRA